VVDQIEVPSDGWEKEEIPDDDFLFMRVHRSFLDSEDKPIPGAFRNRPKVGGGMSTDWAKYSTPEDAWRRARVPEDNIVIRFIAGQVRRVPGRWIEHTPDRKRNNRAHTDVWGEETAEARVRFGRIYQIVPLDDISPIGDSQ